METPTVSIITPSFNSGKFIAEAIASVKRQTFTDWEMIIVDDCSQDNTVSLIKSHADQDRRIVLLQLPVNSGPGVARNTALKQARGKFIAFLDSDDVWKPEKLERQLDFMDKNQIPFTFSFYDCINEQGIPLNIQVRAPRNLSYRQLFFCNFVGNLTGIYDARYFGKIEISSIRKRQDWIIWLTILKKIGSAKAVTESLALYRIRQNSVSASKTSLIRHNFGVYRSFHKCSCIAALGCMAVFLFTQLFIKPRYIVKLKH